MSDVVLKEVHDDGVAVLTLNRPKRLNAWTGELEQTYFDLLRECAASPDVRVIVVTGAGRHRAQNAAILADRLGASATA